MKGQSLNSENISRSPEKNKPEFSENNFGAKRIRIEGVDYDLVNEYMKIFTRRNEEKYFLPYKNTKTK